MSPEPDAYTLADLCDLAGVTPRTVRYYIVQGLLTSPAGAGPGARYGTAHLARLRLVRRLQRDHLPLAEIRRRLAGLSDAEAIARAEETSEPPVDSALDYIRHALATRGVPPVASRLASPPPPAPLASPAGPSIRTSSAPSPSTPRALDAADASPLPDPDVAGPARAAEVAAPYLAPEAPIGRSQWERIALDPDIELHIRRPLSRAHARAVDRLLEVARRLLQEDLP